MSISFKRAIVPAVALLALSAPSFVFAADGDTTTPPTTTANIRVTAGDLTLRQVPAFDFGTINLDRLAPRSTTAVSLPNQKSDALTVTDYTGSGKGWVVKAAITPFEVQGADTKSLLTGSIALTSQEISAETTATQAGLGTTPLVTSDVAGKSGDTVDIFSAVAGKGQGLNAVNFQPGAANLTLNKNVYATGAAYSATITWTLATPVPTDPSVTG
ncbi:WxL domain-containing protein [Lacticaseibacillus brantae]|uniref:WxL domain-containing protein n=1 Tax=Lacticaseibacillus brantae DSM 23927 TaxID=1423727 RepID=A0A0R2AW25_9LACO|nr:WxL domain-containing protein [Lacticaseibacillus brantae]KRM71646.1 hypothetical protein FC34_GL001303 [Lacticaseibacillus brantae DSM 23927]